jgi:V/A-type H+-transporting ATPase subunit F
LDYFFIGDVELVIAFRFVGIDGKAVQNAIDAKEAFRRMTEGWDEVTGMSMPGAETCRVLIITEEVADWLGELLVQWQLADKYPLIVEIPGMIERLPGHKTLVESIREAVGVHI